MPDGNELVRVQEEGFLALFDEAIQRVAALELYEEFYRFGWTRRLAKQTKDELMPLIIRAVVLGWLTAAERAAEVR